MEERVIAQLKDIGKQFPGVVALDHVNMTIRAGSVHALVGENGAGKSTLMKILSGTYVSYDGQILMDGGEVRMKNQKDAFRRGYTEQPEYEEIKNEPVFRQDRSGGLDAENVACKKSPSVKQNDVVVCNAQKSKKNRTDGQRRCQPSGHQQKQEKDRRHDQNVQRLPLDPHQQDLFDRYRIAIRQLHRLHP